MPRSVATVISMKMATLHECDTVYGLQDVYDMLEIALIDAENNAIMERHARRTQGDN